MFLILLAQDPTWWPMYQRDLGSTGFSPLKGAMGSAPTILWSYSGVGYPEQALSAAQVDGQGYLEIAVPGFLSGDIALLSFVEPNSYQVKWVVTTNDYTTSAPALADVNGDGVLDLVTSYRVNSDGIGTRAYSGVDGSVLWTFTAARGDGNSPKVADADGDGALEVLVGSEGLYFYCLNAATGTQEWAANIGRCDAAPAIGDLDNDGRLEVAVSSDNGLYVLNGEDGSVLWSFTGATGHQASPTIIDLDGDGDLDVAFQASSNGYLYAFDGATGTQLWSVSVGVPYNWTTGLAAADADGDGVVEVFAGNSSGVLYCVNGNDGSIQWSYSVGGGDYIHRPVSLMDIDGDGYLEALVPSCCNSPGELIAVNHDGTELWRVELPGDWDVHNPANADVDLDGCAELLVGTYGNTQAAWLLDDAGDASDCGLSTGERVSLGHLKLRFDGKALLVDLGKAENLSLRVYDPSGRLRWSWDGWLGAGVHAFELSLPKGVYLAKARTGAIVKEASLILR